MLHSSKGVKMNDRTAYLRINGNDDVNDNGDNGEASFKATIIPQAPLMDDVGEDENEPKTQGFLRNPLARSTDKSHEFQRLPSDDEESLTPTSNSNSNQSKNTASTTTYPPTEDTEEEYSSHPSDFEISTNDEDDDSSGGPPPNPFEITNDLEGNLEPKLGDDDNRTPRKLSLLNRANSYILSDDEDDDDYDTNQFHKYLTPSKPTEPIHEQNFREDEMYDNTLFSMPSSHGSSFKRLVVDPIKRVISDLHFEQERSRQRRIERLLYSLPDDDGRSACHYIASKAVLCVSSAWCDLTDSRGWMLLLLFSVTVFLVWYILENLPIHREWILIVGGLALLSRIGYKPLHWFLWGRRAERRRKVTLELYDGLNGENGTKGMEIPHDDEVDQVVKAENRDSTSHSPPDDLLPENSDATTLPQTNAIV